MIRKASQNLTPVYYSLVLLLGLFMGYNLSNHSSSNSFFAKNNKSSLQEIYNLVQSKYVDNINTDSLCNATAESFLSQLDPHSVYIPPSELETINNQLEGKFTGLGIRYFILNDTLTITEILENGAAKKAGVEIGDKIFAINDTTNLIFKSNDEEIVKNKLKGEVGSMVSLNIKRNNIVKKILVKRETIGISSVDAAYMLNTKIGYIKINKFAERTYEEFMVELEKLLNQKMEGLVIDLRGNPGGFMHAATAIADEFLDGDKLIVYTEGVHSPKDEKFCKKEGMFEKGKLVVLIDEGSASASEVLAGALQDWDRATIIGKRSFGKGLVQQQYNLSNGGALRITTARYYSPLGRNIQKPYAQGKDKYLHEVYERKENNLDSTTIKSKSFYTPKGKKVFGGGGIMPDVIVNEDTSLYQPEYINLFRNNTIEKFVLYLLQNNKEKLLALKTTSNFSAIDELTNSNWLIFESIAKADSVQANNIDARAKIEIKARVKQNLTKMIAGNNAYYKVANASDSCVIKALDKM